MPTPTMTYGEYLGEVTVTMMCYPEWRRGQAAFNTLARIRPELAEKVNGSIRDPFYKDLKLPSFYDWVEEHWNDGQER